MKMDNQRRIRIPSFVFEEGIFNKSDYCYIAYLSEDKIILTKKKSGQKVIAKVKLDERGRFIVPKDLAQFFGSNEWLMFLEGNNVGFITKMMS